jgi:plasmid stabilization system protein ParE
MGKDLPRHRGLRYFPIKDYIIVYKVEPDSLRIIRVFHGARRWRELL